MPIQYRCPKCQAKLSIGTRMAGYSMACPSCGAMHQVPERESEIEAGQVEESSEPQAAVNVGRQAEQHLFASQSSPAAVPDVPNPPQHPRPRPIQAQDDGDEEFELRPFDRESDEMDLTPMVDCVFLLLIFFMITASFTVQKTIEVPPPDPDKKGATQSIQVIDDLERTSVLVQIDAQNSITIDDEPLADPAGLTDMLRDKMHSNQKNELVIEAHAAAFHETVVAVVDAANEVQFQRVRLATTPGTESN